MTKEQTAKFCRLGDADRTIRAKWGLISTIVTGLYVQWNDDTGTPERIIFGCFGGEGGNGNGNFGRVGRNYRKNLIKVMEGAFTEAVLFLPHELEGTFLPRATKDETTASVNSPVYTPPSSSSRIYNTFSLQSFCFAMIGGILMCLAIYKRR